jgi:hypothetical protein
VFTCILRLCSYHKKLVVVSWCGVEPRLLNGYCTSPGWWWMMMWVEQSVEWLPRETPSTRTKPAPVPLCPLQIQHDLTRAAAMGSQRLTAWATVRPYKKRTRRYVGTTRSVLAGMLVLQAAYSPVLTGANITGPLFLFHCTLWIINLTDIFQRRVNTINDSLFWFSRGRKLLLNILENTRIQ